MSDRSFAIEQAIEPRSAGQQDGVVRIALIGDSWVGGERLDPVVIELLSSYGWKVELGSFAQGRSLSRQLQHFSTRLFSIFPLVCPD